jgi:hypothetical protein
MLSTTDWSIENYSIKRHSNAELELADGKERYAMAAFVLFQHSLILPEVTAN